MWAEKNEALETVLAQIEKQFGKGSVMKLDKYVPEPVPVISSGDIMLDEALGVGGFPRGRVIEVYGPESSGKTTLSLHVIAEAQKNGGTAAFIDAEHALDLAYARKLGVKVDKLILSQPDCGEQALDIVEILVKSGALDVIVIDSVAALVPRAEINGEMGDSHMGLQARLMSQALRKLTAVGAKSQCLIIFINQLRQKIGVIFGNPEVTTGGNALKFYSSMRLEIRRIASIKQGDEFIGNKVRVKVVKNKLAPPFTSVEIEILFNEGFSKFSSLIDAAVNHNIMIKSGSWYAYNGNKVGQGKESAKQFLKEHPDITEEIQQTLKSKLFSIEEATVEPDPPTNEEENS